MFEVPKRKREKDDRSNLMELELELGDHAKIAAPASNRPEQIWVLIRRGPEEVSIRSNEFHRDEVVAAQTTLAAQPADTSSKGKPADTCVADEPTRGGQTMLLGGRIQL